MKNKEISQAGKDLIISQIARRELWSKSFKTFAYLLLYSSTKEARTETDGTGFKGKIKTLQEKQQQKIFRNHFIRRRIMTDKKLSL